MREQLKSSCKLAFQDILDVAHTGWIAGGSLRDFFSRMPLTSDVDLFFASDAERQEAARRLSASGVAKPLYDHSHVQCFMFKNRHVQLIKKHFFAGPEETISQFDFTVCCVAMSSSGELFHHENFFEDLAGRRLAINQLPFPLSTLERLQKYVAKGFVACNGTLMEIAKGIQAIDLNNPNENTLTFYPGGGVRFARFD
jgi:hypothetical protein